MELIASYLNSKFETISSNGRNLSILPFFRESSKFKIFITKLRCKHLQHDPRQILMHRETHLKLINVQSGSLHACRLIETRPRNMHMEQDTVRRLITSVAIEERIKLRATRDARSRDRIIESHDRRDLFATRNVPSLRMRARAFSSIACTRNRRYSARVSGTVCAAS